MTETPNPHIVDADTLSGQLRPIRRCVLAIGSNLGERLNNLQGAVSALADTPEVWVIAVSPVYETGPLDAPEGSQDFLNAVVLAESTLSTRTLLDRALAIEDAYGRERTAERGSPRTLDVDLIVVGDRSVDAEDLVLPHPKAHERAFVLAPWNDVEPGAELLGRGPVNELLGKVADQPVTLRDDLSLSFS